MADALDAAAPRGPAAPYWIGLDRQAHGAQLAELRQWADTVLRRHYGGYELRDCWPSHIHAIWELSTLAAAWHHAYGGQRPDLARALDFYDRWLPAPCAASPTSPGPACRNASRAVVPGDRSAPTAAGKRRTRRASTTRGYESHVRIYLKPAIGDLPLERLNAGHVETVLAAVPGSAGTRHRVLATRRSALSAAVKQRQIPWNPCAGIELEPENPAEAQRWTPEQAARFLHHVADDPMGLMFRVMVPRGCRRAELVGFRWAGADLDRGVLTGARPILQLGGKLHEEATAKSRAGDRLVFLDRKTAELLRAHRETQELERMLAGEAWQDHDLIFCQPDGRPWNPDHVSKRFKRLAAQAGVPVIKLHEGGRHTGNSLMRDAGMDREVRMREVGHASTDINDRYTHVLEEAHLAAASRRRHWWTRRGHERDEPGCSKPVLLDATSVTSVPPENRFSSRFRRSGWVGRVGLEPTTGGL